MNCVSRRTFLSAAAAAAASPLVSALPGVSHAGGSLSGSAFLSAAPRAGTPAPREETGEPCPIRLGLASYTFRSFTRAQMIEFMKQLRVTGLNAKDAKDHLPMKATAEAQALEEYKANGIELHAVGTVYFPKDEDGDIRGKFEYAKRAGVKVIVAGDPAPATLPRIEKFVKEYDIRIAIHNHGPEDKIFPSPLDVLKAVKGMDERMGCCIDVGHCVRAGTDVVEAIHTVGPRLYNMHIKDLANMTEKESQVEVGRGRMPVREIFKALIETKYPGWVDLEYEIHGDNPMPGVIESFAYMHGVLTGMGYGGSK